MTDRPCNAIRPVAWRVEVRWADRRIDQTWRKYADYGTLKSAELSQQRFADPGDIESRIVPLYAGTPEQHTNTQRSRP